jgi:hypothetical protein
VTTATPFRFFLPPFFPLLYSTTLIFKKKKSLFLFFFRSNSECRTTSTRTATRTTTATTTRRHRSFTLQVSLLHPCLQRTPSTTRHSRPIRPRRLRDDAIRIWQRRRQLWQRAPRRAASRPRTVRPQRGPLVPRTTRRRARPDVQPTSG